MKYLIVNADDLGLTDAINAGIFRAIDAGVVSDVSLLAVGESYDDAIEGLRRRKIDNVGLHFCAVDGEKAISSAISIQSICDAAGRFFEHRNRLFLQVVFDRKMTLQAINLELNAQIGKIRDSHLTISHLDSHQHIHLLPGIARLFVQACYQNKIPYLRVPDTLPYSPIKFVVACLAARLRTTAVRRNVNYISFAGFGLGSHFSADSLKREIRRAMKSVYTELIVHPGTEDPYTRSKYAHWHYQWDRNLTTLLGAGSYLAEQGCRIVSYHELAELKANG